MNKFLCPTLSLLFLSLLSCKTAGGGQASAVKIYGGEQADSAKYPWMVALGGGRRAMRGSTDSKKTRSDG